MVPVLRIWGPAIHHVHSVPKHGYIFLESGIVGDSGKRLVLPIWIAVIKADSFNASIAMDGYNGSSGILPPTTRIWKHPMPPLISASGFLQGISFMASLA